MIESNKKLIAVFEAILFEIGFEKQKNFLGFVKVTPKSKYLVDIYNRTSEKFFEIDLIRYNLENNTQQSIGLGGFIGNRFYSYENSIEEAVNLAVEHLINYGIPWLQGNTIETDYLKKEEMLQSEFSFNRLVTEARENFKKQNYHKTIELFEEAQLYKTIDNRLDLKYLEIAKKSIKEA